MIIVIIFIVAIVGLYVASSATTAKSTKPTPTPIPTIQPTLGPPPTISFTVTSQVGMSNILFRDQSTGSSMTLVTADLPWTFNVKYGDTVQLKAVPVTGYHTNSWVCGDKTVLSPDNSGYLTMKVTYPFSIEARFLMDATG
jgi:hypothetical protein